MQLLRSQLEALMADGRPLMLAMAEQGAVFTFSLILSTGDLAADDVELDTTLASTITSRLMCPGGVYPEWR